MDGVRFTVSVKSCICSVVRALTPTSVVASNSTGKYAGISRRASTRASRRELCALFYQKCKWSKYNTAGAARQASRTASLRLLSVFRAVQVVYRESKPMACTEQSTRKWRMEEASYAPPSSGRPLNCSLGRRLGRFSKQDLDSPWTSCLKFPTLSFNSVYSSSSLLLFSPTIASRT